MFGDVEDNENSIKLEKVAKVSSSHRVFTHEFVNEGVPFYRGTEISELSEGKQPSDPYFISLEHYNRIANDDSKPMIGDLLFPSICNKGQVWMVDTEKPFYYKDGRVLSISPDRKLFNCKYFQYYMREKLSIEFPKLTAGATFAEFKIFILKDLDIFVPEINKQNQFAAIVEQIDKSKFIT